MRLYFVYLGMKSWWEKGCVVQLPLSLSLSLSFTPSQNIRVKSRLGEGRKQTRTRTLNMRIQINIWTKKIKEKRRQKWPLVSYILVSNKRKKNKKKLCRLVYYWHKPTPIARSHIHTHSQKYSLLELTPFVWFFLLFLSLLFLGKCKSSSFFRIHFSIALLFI